MYDKSIALLEERGVTLEDIVDCVVYLQEGYVESIDRDEVLDSIHSVLQKREVQHALFTGIQIDKETEAGVFGDAELNDIIRRDEGLYGIDEVVAYGICNLYGSIALTNFGYIDKIKPGIIGRLNEKSDTMCHTFLDDIVGAIAASAASKLAHTN